MAILAIGFKHPEYNGLIADSGLKTDIRGNVAATDFQTNYEGVLRQGTLVVDRVLWFGQLRRADRPQRKSISP